MDQEARAGNNWDCEEQRLVFFKACISSHNPGFTVLIESN